MNMNGPTIHTLPGSSQFPTTLWTLVVAAGNPQRNEARLALASLCESYWYPLYAYLRRRGYPADRAQDLTQGFFIQVLEGRYLDRADPEKGRFRSFILTSLKFFVVLWISIVAYPLWVKGALWGSSAEAITTPFLWVILPIVAVPQGYVFRSYIYKPGSGNNTAIPAPSSPTP